MKAKEDPKEKTNKIERKRYVNIIYFVDSSRTHTFKLPLSSGIFAAVLIAAMLLWSIIASAVVIYASAELSRKQQRITNLMTTIFSYQSRYDQVYERSYPEHVAELKEQTPEETKSVAKPKKRKPKNDKISLAAKAIEEIHYDFDNPEIPISRIQPDILSYQADIEDLPTKKQKDADHTVVAEKTLPITSGPNVKIDEIKENSTNESFEIKFALYNNDTINPSSGYVVGLASFKDESGNETQLVSPENFKPNSTILLDELARNHKFHIRYYTTKLLKFKKPDNKQGKIESITFLIGDTEGNRREIVYNLDSKTFTSDRSVEGPTVKE